jgi:kinesin family protein 13
VKIYVRTRVNGTLITGETLLHHSDRIVLGLNHYFRINCPNKARKESINNNNIEDFNEIEEDDEVDYACAIQEVLINDNNNYFQKAFDLQNNKYDNHCNNNNSNKNDKFKIALNKLQEQLIRANTLVREANVLSKEMNKQTLFNVTLQISPLNLKLNRNVCFIIIIIIIDFI